MRSTSRIGLGSSLLAGLTSPVMLAVWIGCSPTEREFNAEGGAGGASSSIGAGGAAGAGDGGSGGAPQRGDFTFSIVPLSVNVPYDGLNPVEITISRSGGLSAPVEVQLDAPPPGLSARPVTVPEGEEQGALEVGASGPLMLGTQFRLKLIARAGDLVRRAEVDATVTGKPGSLDTSFGGTGVYSAAHATDGGTLLAIMRLNEGTIFGAGDAADNGGTHFFTTRLLPHGAPDMAFDMDGKKAVNLCGCSNDGASVRGIARQVSGRIVAAGSRLVDTSDIALVRLRENGSLDPAFGDLNGMITHDFGGREELTDLALTAEDQIVVVGSKDGSPLLARFKDDGRIDEDFAAPLGFVVTSVPGALRAVAIDGEGRIVSAGAIGSGPTDAAVARRLPDGRPDPSFGTGGVVVLGVSSIAEEAVGVALLPGGRILVAGHAGPQDRREIVAWRLRSDGSLDASFGMNGHVVVPMTDGDDAAAALQLLPDGRAVILGNTRGGDAPGPFLVRLRSDGAPDPTFGDGGLLRPYVGPRAQLWAIDLQPDGKLLVAGDIEEGYPRRGVVARLWN